MKKQVKEAKGRASMLYVSPSAWMVWEKCALSLQAVRSTLVLERDEYAKEGTRLHKAIAESLKGAPVVLDNTDDTALVRFAVETVKRELTGATYAVESPLSVKVKNVVFSGTPDVIVSRGNAVTSGTPDVIVSRGNTITVMDHKMGWREVEADGNDQLKLYAHMAAQNENIKWWKGIVINARFNSVSYAYGEIDSYYLSATANDLLARTAKKQFQTGNHCAYCQRLSTCAKIRAAIAKWIKPGAIDGITREPEKLAEALRLAKPAEKLFETIKKEAQLFIDLGGAIPGVAIEYTAGTRTWPRDLTVQEIAEKIGVGDVTKLVDMKIMSPAQAEKIGADKDAINAIAIRPPRKGFKFI